MSSVSTSVRYMQNMFKDPASEKAKEAEAKAKKEHAKFVEEVVEPMFADAEDNGDGSKTLTLPNGAKISIAS